MARINTEEKSMNAKLNKLHQYSDKNAHICVHITVHHSGTQKTTEKF